MEKNYFTDIVGIGVTFPIQLTRNEKGETGWYPVNGDFKLIRDNISAILYYMIGQRFRQENFPSQLWHSLAATPTTALLVLLPAFFFPSLVA